jgi:GTPase SAR1 family protein
LKYRNGKDRFTIWDLGGKSSIRKIWENYYPECHGVIYMFNHNIEEGISTLSIL